MGRSWYKDGWYSKQSERKEQWQHPGIDMLSERDHKETRLIKVMVYALDPGKGDKIGPEYRKH